MFFVLFLAGCAWLGGRGAGPDSPPPEATAASGTTAPGPGATSPAEPTSQGEPAEPLAALVNGQPVFLAAYEREVARCQAGLQAADHEASACPGTVLENLIEQALVEQAAGDAGIALAAAEVEAALASIAGELGGAEAYAAWLEANHYTPDEFREALRRDLLRARMAEAATAHVGGVAEQVHARALVVADEPTAQAVLSQLQAGADFATLALTYSLDLSSRAAGGDLGWFPRGLLSVPEVEDAAFALAVGETSSVIRSELGYHIVESLERDPARPLSPAAEQVLKARAYQAWLDGLLAQAEVTKFIDP